MIQEEKSNIYFHHTDPIETCRAVEGFQCSMTPFDQILNDDIELTAADRASKCMVSLL